MTIKQEYHFPVDQETLVIDLIAENTNFSRQKIKQFMQKGCVWLEQEVKAGSTNDSASCVVLKKVYLKVGDILHFYYDEKVLE